MSNVLLEIKNLSKKYNNKEVVSRESFKLLEGDILGFIDQMEQGKAHLSICLLRLCLQIVEAYTIKEKILRINKIFLKAHLELYHKN